MKIPEGFRSITPADKDLILRYAKNYGEELSCEYSLGNLLAWEDIYKCSFLEKSDRLWIYCGKTDLLFFPLGREISASELIDFYDILRTENLAIGIDQVPEKWIETHDIKGFSFVKNPDFLDYVYTAEKLATLPGRSLEAKRNLIRQFERSFPDYRVEELKVEREMPEEIQKLLGKWLNELPENLRHGSVDEDLHSLKKAFKLWDVVPFGGVLIRCENECVAFCVYSISSNATADIHFEKMIHSVKGASQILNRETARILQKQNIKWINREQDLGIQGLRHAKQSYSPDFQIQVGKLMPETNGNCE